MPACRSCTVTLSAHLALLFAPYLRLFTVKLQSRDAHQLHEACGHMQLSFASHSPSAMLALHLALCTTLVISKRHFRLSAEPCQMVARCSLLFVSPHRSSASIHPYAPTHVCDWRTAPRQATRRPRRAHSGAFILRASAHISAASSCCIMAGSFFFFAALLALGRQLHLQLLQLRRRRRLHVQGHIVSQ